jgi:hypothetical protein
MATAYKNYKGDLITNCPKPEGTCWQPLHLTKAQRKQQLESLKHGESMTFIDSNERDPFTSLGDYVDFFNEDLIGGKYSRSDLMERGLSLDEINNIVNKPKKGLAKATWSSALLTDIDKRGILEVNRGVDSDFIIGGISNEIKDYRNVPEEESPERIKALSQANAKQFYYIAVSVNANRDKYDEKTVKAAENVLGSSYRSLNNEMIYNNPLKYQAGKSYLSDSVHHLHDVAKSKNREIQADPNYFESRKRMYDSAASNYNKVADGTHFEKPNNELIQARVRNALLRKRFRDLEEKEYNSLRGRLGFNDSKELSMARAKLQSSDQALARLES